MTRKKKNKSDVNSITGEVTPAGGTAIPSVLNRNTQNKMTQQSGATNGSRSNANNTSQSSQGNPNKPRPVAASSGQDFASATPRLNSTSGSRQVYGSSGSRQVNSTSGSRQVYESVASHPVNSTSGSRQLYESSGSRQVNATSGSRQVYGSSGSRPVNSTSGSRQVYGSSSPRTIYTSSGSRQESSTSSGRSEVGSYVSSVVSTDSPSKPDVKKKKPKVPVKVTYVTKQIYIQPRHPVLTVERLKDLDYHVNVLTEALGRRPRVFQQGRTVRFVPETNDEYKIVQRYLAKIEAQERISWCSYTLPPGNSLKVNVQVRVVERLKVAMKNLKIDDAVKSMDSIETDKRSNSEAGKNESKPITLDSSEKNSKTETKDSVQNIDAVTTSESKNNDKGKSDRSLKEAPVLRSVRQRGTSRRIHETKAEEEQKPEEISRKKHYVNVIRSQKMF